MVLLKVALSLKICVFCGPAGDIYDYRQRESPSAPAAAVSDVNPFTQALDGKHHSHRKQTEHDQFQQRALVPPDQWVASPGQGKAMI